VAKLKQVTFNLGMTIKVQQYEPIKLEASQTWELEDYKDPSQLKEEMKLIMNSAKLGLIRQIEEMSDKRFMAKCSGLNSEIKSVWNEITGS